MNALDQWTAAACRELGLEPAEVATGPVLDLARDVAHWGAASGRAGDRVPGSVWRSAAARIRPRRCPG